MLPAVLCKRPSSPLLLVDLNASRRKAVLPSKARSARGSGRGSTRSQAATAEHELAETSEEERPGPTATLVGVEAGVYTVEGSFSTHASSREVWDVLTDYERLAEVFSNIKSTQLFRRETDIILQQDCKWEFLIFSGKFGAELSVHEDWDALVLTFELLKSSFMRSFVGQWHVQPDKAGNGTLIRHRLAVEPMVSPPPFMAGYTQKIFVKQVASILRDLDEEMHRYSSADFSYRDL